MLDTSEFWQKLTQQGPYYRSEFDLQRAFREQPNRFATLHCHAPYIRADLSKHLWSRDVLQNLIKLADTSELFNKRSQLLNGTLINPTEKRTIDHAFWRHQAVSTQPPAALREMLQLAEQIRQDDAIKHVVHIGVGGSGLGPQMSVLAMEGHTSCHQTLHFVTNMDGHDLLSKTKDLNPEQTLFIIISKSWCTQETLQNAHTAITWFREHGGQDINRHFVAISARPDSAQAMGIQQVLTLPEGMGGRTSIWSTVGLALALALGTEGFMSFLRGGAAMDAHFATAPATHNLPLWLGLSVVWNHTFLQMSSRCIAPYHHYLRRLPAYLQQLDMESNGKRVDLQGRLLPYHTTAVIWGEAGSTGQHAFFQWLHQSTRRIPVEFITVRQPQHDLTDQHHTLLANALAQSQALMIGSQATDEQLSGHQDFPGNRPSTMLMLEDLSPASLGALLALYEHRVFVSGIIWGINSFDQFGVELGKTLAADIAPRLKTGDTTGLDTSTAGLIQWIHPTSC